MENEYLVTTREQIKRAREDLNTAESLLTVLREVGETTSQYEGPVRELKRKIKTWEDVLEKHGIV